MMDTIGIWLLASSAIVFFTVVIKDIVMASPPLPRNAAKKKGIATKRLTEDLAHSARWPELTICWDQYRDLSNLEISAVAERFGWLFVDDEVTSQGWELRFVRTDRAGER